MFSCFCYSTFKRWVPINLREALLTLEGWSRIDVSVRGAGCDVWIIIDFCEGHRDPGHMLLSTGSLNYEF